MRGYVGWIPTATGKLSFSQIGDGASQNNAACFNTLTAGGNSIFAIEQRKSLDGPLDATLMQLIDKRTSDGIFALQAKISDGELPYTKDFNAPGLPNRSGPTALLDPAVCI